MFEATACAIHGVDRIRPPVGARVLLLGSGATGLCLAQLLKLNGSGLIVLAANAGQKMDLARNLGVADEYVDLDRKNPQPLWEKLRNDYPYGFDIVVEATGDPAVIETAMGFCGRGGMLVLYGVYSTDALVEISPSKVFLDEITIIGYASRFHPMPGGVELIHVVAHFQRCGVCPELLSILKVAKSTSRVSSPTSTVWKSLRRHFRLFERRNASRPRWCSRVAKQVRVEVRAFLCVLAPCLNLCHCSSRARPSQVHHDRFRDPLRAPLDALNAHYHFVFRLPVVGATRSALASSSSIKWASNFVD